MHIAGRHATLARLHGDAALRARARPFELFLATGMDFDASSPALDVTALLAGLA